MYVEERDRIRGEERECGVCPSREERGFFLQIVSLAIVIISLNCRHEAILFSVE